MLLRAHDCVTTGYIDPNVTSQPMKYTPVDNSQGFWQVPSTSDTVNGTTHERSGHTTILDTGTTLMLIEDSAVEAIYSKSHHTERGSN